MLWAKFLSLAATNAAIILCCGHCPVHYRTRYHQALPPRCQEHQPSTCDFQKCLPTSPNVPWGAKVVLVENCWVRVFWIKVTRSNTWNAEGSLFLEISVVVRNAAQCTEKEVSAKLQRVVQPEDKASILFSGSDGFLESGGKKEQSGHGTHISPHCHLKTSLIQCSSR